MRGKCEEKSKRKRKVVERTTERKTKWNWKCMREEDLNEMNVSAEK